MHVNVFMIIYCMYIYIHIYCILYDFHFHLFSALNVYNKLYTLRLFIVHPLEVDPLNTARRYVERCKLPQWGMARSPADKRFGAFLSQKGQLWWQHFLRSFAICILFYFLCPKLSHDYLSLIHI